MKRQTTQFLLLLLLVSGVAAIVAWLHLQSAEQSASTAANDLLVCRQDLDEMRSWQNTSPPAAGASGDDLNRRLRGAATVAHLTNQLASIEPGTPVHVRDSAFTHTPIYLRLNDITLRELTVFLHDVISNDAILQATTIELGTPPVPAPSAAAEGETWTADITLSQLGYGTMPSADR